MGDLSLQAGENFVKHTESTFKTNPGSLVTWQNCLIKRSKLSGLESGRSAVWPEGEAQMQGFQQEEAGSQAWAEQHDRRVEL